MTKMNAVDSRPSSVTEKLFIRSSIARQGLLGLVAVLLDVVTYAGLVILGINHVLATMASSFLGIRTNYTGNMMFNFRPNLEDAHVKRFTAFAIVGAMLAAGVLQIAFWLGAGLWWSKVISLAVVVPMHLLVNGSLKSKSP